jgi:hypothetical protein
MEHRCHPNTSGTLAQTKHFARSAVPRHDRLYESLANPEISEIGLRLHRLPTLVHVALEAFRRKNFAQPFKRNSVIWTVWHVQDFYSHFAPLRLGAPASLHHFYLPDPIGGVRQLRYCETLHWLDECDFHCASMILHTLTVSEYANIRELYTAPSFETP